MAQTPRQKQGEDSGGNSRTRRPLTTPKLSDLGISKTLAGQKRTMA